MSIRKHKPSPGMNFSGIESALMDKEGFNGVRKIEAWCDRVGEVRNVFVYARARSSHPYLREALAMASIACWNKKVHATESHHYLHFEGAKDFGDNVDGALVEGHRLFGLYTEEGLFRLELVREDKERKDEGDEYCSPILVRKQGIYVEAERFELAYEQLNELYVPKSLEEEEVD